MENEYRHTTQNKTEHSPLTSVVIVLLCVVMIFPHNAMAVFYPKETTDLPDRQEIQQHNIEGTTDSVTTQPDTLTPIQTDTTTSADSVLTIVTADGLPSEFSGRRVFNPDPSRAVWLSALVPGLGQIYNRRYWKLPIIIGGFMGLGYATSWNNNQYKDYTQAYGDLTDSDPSTNSYMNFFPPNTKESDLDRTWITNTMKSRKDYYRRNRDLCIICMVGLYLLCMVDAYVDASLAHFDISPDLSLDIQPAMFIAPVDNKVTLGLNWAFNF